MCGWVASLSRDSSFFQHLIKHRGTRTKYVYPITHRRLPIVGLGNAYDQPVEVGEWVIAWAGEILNFREDYPSMKCDTELVADTWQKEGPNGFKNFDGFWSIVAYNKWTHQLHLFNDYLAQKPTYYSVNNGSAASEPNAVAAMCEDVTPDEFYFAAVCRWGYCPDLTRTPYNEVKRLLPGEHVVLTKDGVLSKHIVDQLTPLSLHPEELKDEIIKAVKRRVCSSDVPVACLVSGGLDSAITFSLASRYAEIRPYYVGDDGEELDRAIEVVGDGCIVRLPPPKIKDEVCIDVFQEPVDLGSLAPQIALSQVVKESVCLSGDGADECFGGYSRSNRYDSQQTDIFSELPGWHLTRLDRIMMAHCIEMRSPFLARNVVRAALALPRAERTNKKILKELFAPQIPMSVILAKKIPLREEGWDQHRRSNELVKLYRERNML